MAEKTLKKSVDFLLSSNRKNLQLQFFGGEPLMLPDDVFRRTVKYAVEGARKLGKDIKIIITTNSVYLNDEKISFLENYEDNIIVEVSLDGDKESQNTNRPQKDDKKIDSYTIITKNFPKLLKSRLNYRISMVVSPETCKKLLHNFEHLLEWGFRKIWIMLACGVKWSDEDIDAFYEQLTAIGNKYYEGIKSGKIVILNLRDWFAPYRMNTELIIDLNEKIYPACLNYLIDSEEIKEEFCLGDLNDLQGKNIDYYDSLRISNDHSISLFFKENKIIPNYESNIKTGFMINRFVREMADRLKKDGVSVRDLFRET
jgi:sulfatase maturation enzyme AslB (radical SAM superfamily)